MKEGKGNKEKGEKEGKERRKAQKRHSPSNQLNFEHFPSKNTFLNF